MQPRTDEDGYDLKFVLWNNLDNGLFGAVARCAKVVDTVASLLGKFFKDNFEERYVKILTHSFPMHPFCTPPCGFLMFQGLVNGCVGNKWVNLILQN